MVAWSWWKMKKISVFDVIFNIIIIKDGYEVDENWKIINFDLKFKISLIIRKDGFLRLSLLSDK